MKQHFSEGPNRFPALHCNPSSLRRCDVNCTDSFGWSGISPQRFDPVVTVGVSISCWLIHLWHQPWVVSGGNEIFLISYFHVQACRLWLYNHSSNLTRSSLGLKSMHVVMPKQHQHQGNRNLIFILLELRGVTCFLTCQKVLILYGLMCQRRPPWSWSWHHSIIISLFPRWTQSQIYL